MLKEFSWSNSTTLDKFYFKEAILEEGKVQDNQYNVGKRFYEIKVRITQRARSILQGNFNFMKKIEAKYLMIPLSGSVILLSFSF